MLNHQAQVLTSAALAALLLGAAAPLASASPAETPLPDAAALYGTRCAACHDHPADRIPSRIGDSAPAKGSGVAGVAGSAV